MDNQTIIHDLPMSKFLYDILNTYINETEYDEISYSSIDDFIISAIIEKFNNECEIFSEIDENGFVNEDDYIE